jgi:hypothetical protein
MSPRCLVHDEEMEFVQRVLLDEEVHDCAKCLADSVFRAAIEMTVDTAVSIIERSHGPKR